MWMTSLSTEVASAESAGQQGTHQVCQFGQVLIGFHVRRQSCKSWWNERSDSFNLFDQVSSDLLHADMGCVRNFWLFVLRPCKPNVLVIEDQCIPTCLTELAEPVVVLPTLVDGLRFD